MTITLYSTHCPKCTVLEKKLTNKGIDFEVCDDEKIMESYGFTTLPMLQVDTNLMDFSTAIKWVGEYSAN
jgi:glutaredoxin